MMRKVFSIALLICVFGLAQSALAGVTIDLQFQDSGSPSGITISPGDAGPGCTFTGYYGNTVASGYCMEVILKVSDPDRLVALEYQVTYDSDNGLAVASAYDMTKGIAATAKVSCQGDKTINQTASPVGVFDCLIAPGSQSYANGVQNGTYRIGTIVWDTSATTAGSENLSVTGIILGVIDVGGTVTEVNTASGGSHVINIIPEPGTASLLGLGLLGLILAGRRSRA